MRRVLLFLFFWTQWFQFHYWLLLRLLKYFTLETSEVGKTTLETSDVDKTTLETSEAGKTTLETSDVDKTTLETSEAGKTTLWTSTGHTNYVCGSW